MLIRFTGDFLSCHPSLSPEYSEGDVSVEEGSLKLVDEEGESIVSIRASKHSLLESEGKVVLLGEKGVRLVEFSGDPRATKKVLVCFESAKGWKRSELETSTSFLPPPPAFLALATFLVLVSLAEAGYRWASSGFSGRFWRDIAAQWMSWAPLIFATGSIALAWGIYEAEKKLGESAAKGVILVSFILGLIGIYWAQAPFYAGGASASFVFVFVMKSFSFVKVAAQCRAGRGSLLSEKDVAIAAQRLSKFSTPATRVEFARFLASPSFCFSPAAVAAPRPTRLIAAGGYLALAIGSLLTSFWVLQELLLPLLAEVQRGWSFPAGILKAPLWFARTFAVSTLAHHLGFVSLFMGYCEFFAEISGSAARVFYLDWWAAENIFEFWQRWNLPVHFFIKRHIMPKLRELTPSGPLGVHISIFLAFVISGFFHEVLFTIIFGQMRIVVFVMFILQYPIGAFGVYLGEKMKNKGTSSALLANYLGVFAFGGVTLNTYYYLTQKK